MAMMDRDKKRAERLGVTSELPKTFVVDANGIVRAIVTTEGSDFKTVLSELVVDLTK